MADFPSSIPTIDIGGGYVLRAPDLTTECVRDYWLCYNDANIQPFVPDDCIPKTLIDARNDLKYLLDSFDAKRTIFWRVCREDTGEGVGTVNLHTVDHYHNKAEIAYEVRSDYWRRGIGFRACKAVVDFGFDSMNLNRIEATTLTNNLPSSCLLQKLGFNVEGVMAKSKLYKGEFVDIVAFGLSAAQYAEMRRAGLEFVSNPGGLRCVGESAARLEKIRLEVINAYLDGVANGVGAVSSRGRVGRAVSGVSGVSAASSVSLSGSGRFVPLSLLDSGSSDENDDSVGNVLGNVRHLDFARLRDYKKRANV